MFVEFVIAVVVVVERIEVVVVTHSSTTRFAVRYAKFTKSLSKLLENKLQPRTQDVPRKLLNDFRLMMSATEELFSSTRQLRSIRKFADALLLLLVFDVDDDLTMKNESFVAAIKEEFGPASQPKRSN